MKLEILGRKLLFKNHKKILGRSNAFPDYIKFKNQEYICFRTAFFHFPTKSSSIVVFSKKNKIWRLETVFKIKDHDHRNPKFFIHKERLFVIFSVCQNYYHSKGKNFLYISFKKNNRWSAPKKIIYPEGLTSYRARRIGKEIVLSAFNDFSGLNDFFLKPTTHFFISKSPNVWRRSNLSGLWEFPGWETDFILKQKKMIFLSRLDFGYKKNYGSLIMIKNNSTLKVKFLPLRIDAPYLFKLGKKIFLVGRRNLFFHGKYDLAPKFFPDKIRLFINILIYWITPKSLFLWYLDEKKLSLKEIGNFPTFGDNGYAVVIKNNQPNFFTLITYTNMFKLFNNLGKFLPWFIGQFLRTDIISFNFKIVEDKIYKN